jgi:hypothetical protein
MPLERFNQTGIDADMNRAMPAQPLLNERMERPPTLRR